MKLAGLFGGGFNVAVWFAVVFFVLLIGWLIWQRRALTQQPYLLVAAVVIVTLLVSPYLQNYDYILLLVPLFILASNAHRFDWFFIAFAYILPLSLGIFGVPGEISLDISALIIFVLLARVTRQLDVSQRAAYNPLTIE